MHVSWFGLCGFSDLLLFDVLTVVFGFGMFGRHLFDTCCGGGVVALKKSDHTSQS